MYVKGLEKHHTEKCFIMVLVVRSQCLHGRALGQLTHMNMNKEGSAGLEYEATSPQPSEGHRW